ncbi:hypothetical protein AAFF_G00347840 [Aldrovandia affinis]|uniref:Uncharacterized protein n=1 Tax=Aldrovandia affinis TaxID=143900 RepID=A0AAD7WNT9_9TELE|nr:hypothetical protein AAFF_G00347840 [Aldrovandia affinis]
MLKRSPLFGVAVLQGEVSHDQRPGTTAHHTAHRLDDGTHVMSREPIGCTAISRHDGTGTSLHLPSKHTTELEG